MSKKIITGFCLGLVLSVWLGFGFISSAQATVSSTTNRLTYTCNGTTTVYNYTFKIYEDDDLFVAKQDANNVQTTLTLNSDYTVTGAGGSGGTVVLTAGSKCAAGYTLLLLRRVELTQETDYVEGARISANSLETTLDKQIIVAQQNKEELDRALKVQESSTLTNLKVPVVANRVIGWDSAGTGMTTYGTTVAQSAEIDTLANHGGSLNQAITDIGSGSQTLFCDSATTLTASATIPATLHFVALKGCMITKASTYTLTINGPFEAGFYQIFSGFASGNITFGAASVEKIYPQWWGALPTASAAINASALQLAFDAAWNGTTKHKVFIPAGSYDYDTTLTIAAAYVSLEGAGGGVYAVGDASPGTQGNTTVLHYTGTAVGLTVDGYPGVTIRNMHFYGNSNATGGVRIGYTSASGSGLMENVTVADYLNAASGTFGLAIGNAQLWTFKNCSFTHNTNGVLIGNNSIQDVTTMTFDHCIIDYNHNYGYWDKIGSLGTTFKDCVFQGNYNDGIHIDDSLGTAIAPKSLTILGGYVEGNNSSVAGYQIYLKGKSASVRHYDARIISTTFMSGGASMTKHLYLENTDNAIIEINWGGLTNTFANGSNNLGLLFLKQGTGYSGSEGMPTIYPTSRNFSTDRAALSFQDMDLLIEDRLRTSQGVDIASANDITLTNGNYFDITGATQINRILGLGWTIGSIVILKFDGTLTVAHGVAAGSNYYGIQLSGSVNFAATPGDTLMLVFDGAWWREVSRTVI